MDEKMLKMQQDAMNRVRDMQKRARLSIPNENNVHKDKAKIKNPPAKKNSTFDFLKMFNLKDMDIDSDRAIILLIMFLLSGEETDEVLMLALVYLLL